MQAQRLAVDQPSPRRQRKAPVFALSAQPRLPQGQSWKPQVGARPRGRPRKGGDFAPESAVVSPGLRESRGRGGRERGSLQELWLLSSCGGREIATAGKGRGSNGQLPQADSTLQIALRFSCVFNANSLRAGPAHSVSKLGNPLGQRGMAARGAAVEARCARSLKPKGF